LVLGGNFTNNFFSFLHLITKEIYVNQIVKEKYENTNFFKK